MSPALVYLALGANLGDREQNLADALARLEAVPGVCVERVTPWRETDPVDAPGTPKFLNAVAALRVSLPAQALLAVCKQLEQEAGRDLDAPRNAPRPLDLDILLYGDETIDTRELRVPHPRMFGREFVMQPLAELTDVSALRPPQSPVVLRHPSELAALASTWLQGGCCTGLVPTMGALHEGHLTLVRAARAECDRVVVSIFVNPLQFGPGEDLDSYPRTLDSDLEQLRALKVDAVFAPRPSVVYPEGYCTTVTTGAEAESLESEGRPMHFEGVTTVVAKLFALARPTRAYFGQKDAQQVAVVRRMAQDLEYPLELRVCPIVRELDGLAMSSRNAYLGAEDRQAAAILYRALCAARDRHMAGDRDAESILAAARAVLESEPRVRIDYLALRGEQDLAPLAPGRVESGRVLIAASLGSADTQVTRLLDNMSLTEEVGAQSLVATSR